MTQPRYILGSRSPRRLELLQLIVPAAQVDVMPPLSPDELDFAGLNTWETIHERLLEVARGKLQQVHSQLTPSQRELSIIIAADTVIVVMSAHSQKPRDSHPWVFAFQQNEMRPRDGYPWASGDPNLCVLGQPPDDDLWRDTVRRWFTQHYAGQTHLAASAVCVAFPSGESCERVVTTAVTMRTDVEPLLDWYLATGEPRGKAGGYAIQGAGSVFIERVEGSLSNVVGLPLEALWDMLKLCPGRF